MSIRKILKYPDTALTEPAGEVSDIDGTIDELINDMLETMYDAPGVGMAAPQVGSCSRVLVADIDVENRGKQQYKLINPVIAEREGSIVWEEGCLSVVDYVEKVKRANHILVKAWTPEQNEIEIDAEGFLAVALQHEIDHLDGKLFIDRISSLKRNIYKRKVKKWIKEGIPLDDKKPQNHI